MKHGLRLGKEQVTDPFHRRVSYLRLLTWEEYENSFLKCSECLAPRDAKKSIFGISVSKASTVRGRKWNLLRGRFRPVAIATAGTGIEVVSKLFGRSHRPSLSEEPSYACSRGEYPESSCWELRTFLYRSLTIA